MDRLRLAESVFIATLAVWLLVMVFYYVQAPAHLASHFDGAGRPNGWSSKTGFFTLTVGMMALLAVVFLWLPRKRFFVSRKLTNLPNKDYWLAPERVEETWKHLREQLLWMGVATAILEGAITALAVDANLTPARRLSPMAAWLLGGYFAFTIGWLVALSRRWGHIPRNP
jgi:uncharacterized membrane protein